MSRFAKPALYLTAVAVAVAVVAVNAQAESHAHFEPENSLLVSTRADLRVCLDTHGDVDAGQVSSQLAGSIGEVREHPHWGPAGYGEKLPELEGGCATTLPDGGLARGVVLGPGVTAEPSPFRTVVVVLDEATADRHLGDQLAVLLPYELMKVGDHVTATVTQAVAVRADFVDDPQFTTEYLTPALGLDPALR